MDLAVHGGTATGRSSLREGEQAVFAVHHLRGLGREDLETVRVVEALEDTTAAWRSWAAEHQAYTGAYREQVQRSALVLQALTYAPSGAVVAAPTTSLPEIAGGEANWDYRFAWLREASLTLRALWVAACPTEASRFFDWCERRGAYAGAFGSDHLDASVLLMGIMGLLPAGDERMLATIDAIEEELAHGGLVRRWTGAGEEEGAFVICSFWLVTCLAQAGEGDRARMLFEHVLSHANDLGLLAEEIDPRDGSLLGNFPQAFSHVGLITAAWAIDQAACGAATAA